MAIFTPGSMIGQISGRIGGQIFSRGAGGPYIRTGTIPTVPQTEYVRMTKINLGRARIYWNQLSREVKETWNEYANQTPTINRLGQQQRISGAAWFVKCNCTLLNAGLNPVYTAPQFDKPIPPVFRLVCEARYTWIEPDDTFQIFISWLPWADIPSDYKLQVIACNMRGSDAIAVRPYMRPYYIRDQEGSGLDGQSGPAYLARFGRPEINDNIWLGLRSIDTRTGLCTDGEIRLAKVYRNGDPPPTP